MRLKTDAIEFGVVSNMCNRGIQKYALLLNKCLLKFQ